MLERRLWDFALAIGTAGGDTPWAMSQENVEIVRRMCERLNARDVPGATELASADIASFPAEHQPEAEGLRGSEAFADYFQGWFDAFDGYEIRVSEYIDLGQYVVAVGGVSGHGRRSGAVVALDDAWMFRLRDGKVVEYRECGTKAQALEAAGLSE
jgi:ketosteroid isomerase-like protein